jgi:hypothetical protein
MQVSLSVGLTIRAAAYVTLVPGLATQEMLIPETIHAFSHNASALLPFLGRTR